MNFRASCNATIIGSFPHAEVDDALRAILECVPTIPAWPQLPFYPEERMVRQYNEGMPGLRMRGDAVFFDTSQSGFESELLEFYEEYLKALDMEQMPLDHKLGISPAYSRGFHSLRQALAGGRYTPLAVKGQIVGPLTLATTLTDQDKRSAYYDSRLREVVIKTLAIKARWQIHQLRFMGVPVIIFIDEPSLSAYGSSAFLGISADDVKNDLQEIIEQIHSEGALAGIHCCENTDWSLLIKANPDILNFDAYGFFDKVVLYAHDLRDFIRRDKIIAWGLIPTGSPEDIKKETAGSLIERWRSYVGALERINIERKHIISQSLITPSCGMGALTPELSERVMHLLKEVSEGLQRDYGAG
ncbi:MAG TPA: hypothetical protein PKV48_01290 [Thermodesulfobacteriota bacterium]|nr:hypothetical protein [Thermodesulfobacteriota bacterium]